MPQSPLTGQTDLVTYSILSDSQKLPDTIQILSIETKTAFNQIASAKIVVALAQDAAANETFVLSSMKMLAPGKIIEIQLGYHATNKMVFRGVIVKIGLKATAESNELILECSDSALKMTVTKKNNYFNEQKDKEILSAIIHQNGLNPLVDTTAYTHPQLVQFNATDWDFLLKRAKANGFFVFTTDNGTIRVRKPNVASVPILEVTYGKDVISMNGQIDARYQLPAVKAQGWDMGNQSIVESTSSEPKVNQQGNLSGKKLATVLKTNDYNLASSSPLEKGELKNWANSTLLTNRLARIYGEVKTIGTSLASLNTLIEIKGFGDRMNGKALITSVQHHVKAGVWTTLIGFGLSPSYFEEEPIQQPIATSALLPSIAGLQNGTVKKIDKDPQGHMRILIDIPIIDTSGEGIWARLSNFYATNNKGVFFMPEKGDEVIVGFLNNDPRFAVVLGSLYSSKNPAPYTADTTNSIKAILTKNDLKLEFNDTDKVITLETPGGNKAIFSDKAKSISLQDQTGNKFEMGTNGITIQSPKEIKIDAKAKIKIDSKADIVLSTASGDVDINGNNINLIATMNLMAKGNMNTTLEAGLNSTIKSGMNMTIKGLMVMIN